MSQKNPWVAALLNFLFIGLGYVYNGKRAKFGWLIFIAVIALFLSVFTVQETYTDTYTPSVEPSSYEEFRTAWFSELLGYFIWLIPIAFAYDAYKEAEEINQKVKKK